MDEKLELMTLNDIHFYGLIPFIDALQPSGGDLVPVATVVSALGEEICNLVA